MKCPILLIAYAITPKGADHAGWECLKEECVWWDDVEKDCLVCCIEKDLAGIWTMLCEMLNKMPTEAQFRQQRR